MREPALISPLDRFSHKGIQLAFLALTIILSSPLLFLSSTALQGLFSLDENVLRGQTLTLLFNSIAVAGAVTTLGTSLGFVLAFLTVKTDLPGKKYWQVALILPMCIPSYIGAIAYTSLLAPRGLVYDWIGQDLWNIYGRDGVIFVLTLFTFPYSYLICLSRLKELGSTWEESALDLGKNVRMTLLKVVIPLCRPALASSALLIALYALADFGSIALLRYNTFTTSIFYQLESFHQQRASLMGFILLSLTCLMVYGRDRFILRTHHETSKKKTGKPYLYPLERYKWPCLFFLSTTITLSFILPVFTMTTHLFSSQEDWQHMWGPLVNGGALALLTATIITVCLPLIIYGTKVFSSFFAIKLCQRVIPSLYGLPSILTALGVLLIAQEYLGNLYGTLFPLLLALIIRFFPVAMEAMNWENKSLSQDLMETSYNLGRGHLKTLKRIFIPLTKRGTAAGFLLVFIGALKELPLQLLLCPPGFRTLSVELWINAQEAFYGQAALYGLLMIFLTTTITPMILRRF